MADLFTTVRSINKDKIGIEELDLLSLNERGSSGSQKSVKPKRVIEEIEASGPRKITPIQSIEPSHVGEDSVPASERASPERQKRNAAFFIQRLYLTDPSPTPVQDDVKEILRNQPTHEELKAVLEYLQHGMRDRHGLDIRIAGPHAAQIMNILVSMTIPDVWDNLQATKLSSEEADIKRFLTKCLTSVVGIGALVSQIKLLSGRQVNLTTKTHLRTYIGVLGEILKDTKVIIKFLDDMQNLYNAGVQQRLYWQEVISLIAGSRILNTVLHATSILSSSGDRQIWRPLWLVDGSMYCKWLGRGIAYAANGLQTTDRAHWAALVQLLQRGLSLGYRNVLICEIYRRLILGQQTLWTPMLQLMRPLSDHEQKVIFDEILQDLSKRYLSGIADIGQEETSDVTKTIAGAAEVLSGIIGGSELLEYHVVELLVAGAVNRAPIDLASRRTLIIILTKSEDKLIQVLEKSLSSFGNKLQIKHSSILQQNACAQTILLSLAYVRTSNMAALKQSVIASLQMQSVSTRLAASVPRARFLGMILGMAYSRIVDLPDQVLDFDLEGIEKDEADQWMRLMNVRDTIGCISDLDHTPLHNTSSKSKVSTVPTALPAKIRALPQTSKIIAIEEMSDSSEDSDEDDDLIPYQKPDSDAEDSDDDPTLINRSKPSAPVYIVDLIKQLSKNDSPEIIALALRTAPALIRRKAGYGTELADNVASLTTTLVNLQQSMEESEYQQLRLEALIACLASSPDIIGPAIAQIYFEGDLSMSQRLVLLTALGLGARELAGFDSETLSSASQDAFPSSQLPPHLEPTKPQVLLSQRQNPVSALAVNAAQSTIRPMALAAADKMTGPSVLKIRTFSSRMEVQKRNEEKLKARTKKIPKDLHNILTKSMYLPLCCRMTLVLSHSSTRNQSSTIFSPTLIRILLQTLTLIFHTLGPTASVHLDSLTHETLLLLINLHIWSSVATDPLVLPSLLHLLLALMDITIEVGIGAQERLIVDHGTQVAELVNWANKLGSEVNVPDLGKEEDGGMPWTVLVAGIQVKWFEMGQKFQGRMLGLVGDDFYNF